MNEIILSIPSGFNIGSLRINFYGLISALAYLMGVLFTMKNAKRRNFKPEDIITLACYVIPLAIIGARLYYVLFRLDHYTNFVDVFKIWEGGLAFYGGVIGGAIGVALYCLIHKKNFLALADIIAPALIIAQGFGRWGNFFNQEAYGNFIENPSQHWFPFAVFIEHCTQDGCLCGGSGWHQATFFYEFFWNMIGFVILQWLLIKVDFKKNGVVASLYFVIYGIGRTIIEGLRTDSLYLGSLRVSQLVSIILIIVGLSYIVYYFITTARKKKSDSFSKIMKILKTDLK